MTRSEWKREKHKFVDKHRIIQYNNNRRKSLRRSLLICGRGEIGRRKGLKIPRWWHRTGSSPVARTMKKAFAVANAFFSEIRSFGTSEISSMWNIASQMWNTPAACEIAAAVRLCFTFTWCEASNFTICRANYFTVSEANSNISERMRHHRAHSVGVIEQCSDLGYTVYINRWYEYKRKINLRNYLWPSPFRLLNL